MALTSPRPCGPSDAALDAPAPSGTASRRLTRRQRLVTAVAPAVAATALVVAACGTDATRQEPSDAPSAAASGAATAPSAAPVAAAVVPAGDTRRVVLGVSGMYCTSCERTVTALLARSPGVVRAEVSVDRGEAVVLYDPARTTPAALVGVVERLGYRATVKPTTPT